MSRCFTLFPIGGFRRTLNIPELGLFYNVCGFYLEFLGEIVMMFWVNDLLTLST